MKKRTIIEIFLIILGVSLIAYPIISDYIYSYNQTIVISNYQDSIDELSQEKKDEELKKAQDYNDKLEQDTVVDISLNKKQENENTKYINVLNVGEIMAYISIPKIDVYLPIYKGISDDVLQSGVGHIENSSLPVGGKSSHTVLAGHTGLARTKIFDDIDKLELGDKFYIYVLGQKLAYKVDKIDIVEPENTETIKVEKDKDYVTLVTCTPRVLNTHRLLVRGSRINVYDIAFEEHKSEEKAEVQVEDLKKDGKNKIYLSIIIFIIALILILLIIFSEDISNAIRRRK